MVIGTSYGDFGIRRLNINKMRKLGIDPVEAECS